MFRLISASSSFRHPSGDIIIDGGDISGDRVNLAVRENAAAQGSRNSAENGASACARRCRETVEI
jgi:hypothetical protein